VISVKRIVLASASPRRLELLGIMGVPDLVVIPAKNEMAAGDLPPAEAVRRIALGKAREVAESCGDGDAVIAADTLVYLGGSPLGKPRNRDEAAGMLSRLSGRAHSVFTGVAVICGARELVSSEETRVFFRKIPPDEIERYVDTGEPMDKAGAYGAQGKGAVFIERIEGDFFNVVGLPLCRLDGMLKEMGVDLFA